MILFEGRGRCHPCFAQSPKKPFLKSEKVPQVQIWISTSCLDLFIFSSKTILFQFEKGGRWSVLCGHWHAGKLVIQNNPWLTVWTAVILWNSPQRTFVVKYCLSEPGLWFFTRRNHSEKANWILENRENITFGPFGNIWSITPLQCPNNWHILKLIYKWYISTSILLKAWQQL